MKVEEVIKVLTEFNKWRRGLPPYEWSEDPSTQNDLPYSTRDVGLAIDEAINMLKHEDDIEREKKPKRNVEYAVEYYDCGKWFVYKGRLTLADARKWSSEPCGTPHRIVRREVGEWEEVK